MRPRNGTPIRLRNARLAQCPAFEDCEILLLAAVRKAANVSKVLVVPIVSFRFGSAYRGGSCAGRRGAALSYAQHRCRLGSVNPSRALRRPGELVVPGDQ